MTGFEAMRIFEGYEVNILKDGIEESASQVQRAVVFEGDLPQVIQEIRKTLGEYNYGKDQPTLEHIKK